MYYKKRVERHKCIVSKLMDFVNSSGEHCPYIRYMVNGIVPSRIRKQFLNMPSSDITFDTCDPNPKTAEITADPAWITSGSLGSRDAVLLFSTSILNVQMSEQNGTPPDSLNNSDVNDTAIEAVNAAKGDQNLVTNTNVNSNAKVLSSLPKNTTTNTSNSLSHQKKDNKKAPLPSATSAFSRLISGTSPKKQLHYSLSSSDSSISSECNDPAEIEDDIAKATTTGEETTTNGSNDTTSNGSKCDIVGDKKVVESDCTSNEKHVSFEDTENLNDSKTDNSIKDMPAAKLNITYRFMNTETKLLKRIFIAHGLTESQEEKNFSILWTGVHLKPDILRNLTPYQRVNHFPRSYELTRKDRMYKNIEKMQHLRGFKHFDIVPQSFILPLEYRDLVSAHNKYRGPWIVKPAASSRGRGIFIVNSPEQVPAEEQLLVSKYIADPLCIDGHKCDLRVYVAVTSFDPLIIYIYEEGLVRLATVKYDRTVENLWNPCMHLCNYSINKYHSDYIKSRDADDEDVGHKWTLSALLRHLKSQGCDTKQLMASIEDLIIKSMFACAQSIISACRMFVPNGNNCFELYGFDILIDDTLKPWLLEINLSPSLGIDSPLDTKVKASLITDLLTLVGIPAYSPIMRTHYDTKWTRYRNVNYRRANSADHLNSTSGKKSANNVTTPLTTEEARIVRNAKAQNARRGGFVRIFPTADSMQRYGAFLDPITGIPVSTIPPSGKGACAMILPHNYNQLLYNELFGNTAKHKKTSGIDARMQQYERALDLQSVLNLSIKKPAPKDVEEGKRLMRQVRKLIEAGSELTQLQARQLFSHYLEAVLRRLSQEPRSHHEKLILKFINRASCTYKAPAFLRNPLSHRILSKDRSAMVAKLLGDYLETYNRETDCYVDSFDAYGMIPSAVFNELLSHAQEHELESVLTLHTNRTKSMPFLYNRCGSNVPDTPPIPTGAHGFLKALPSMVAGVQTRDQADIDSYYKNVDLIESTHDIQTSKTEKNGERYIEKAVSITTAASKKKFSQMAKR
ncbi:tubulin polyglutamylase TTLL5 isoform X4 [Hermetia illucens]|nr:tubulin polyglutamylase TTLL5 isoform X4 [Hermetia illucens]